MVEVMLMTDVKKLGKAGAIVKVAPGYARNMLLPQGLAAPVTEAARRRLAKLEEARAKARAEAKKAAQAVADKLAGLTVTVNARTVDGTKLYGSVSATDLLAAAAGSSGPPPRGGRVQSHAGPRRGREGPVHGEDRGGSRAGVILMHERSGGDFFRRSDFSC